MVWCEPRGGVGGGHYRVLVVQLSGGFGSGRQLDALEKTALVLGEEQVLPRPVLCPAAASVQGRARWEMGRGKMKEGDERTGGQ